MKKKAGICVGLILLGVALLIPSGEGRELAPAQKWVARYNGPFNYADYATAVAADKSGNVYVTGKSSGRKWDEVNYATIKYSSTGKELWVQRYDGPSELADNVSAIAVDNSGNVYVSGESYDDQGVYLDFVTIKYNPNGKQLWVQRYDGPGNGSESARALVVDGSGNVYVTGKSWGSGTREDWDTIKYNTNGKPLWTKRYNGPSNDYDEASAIALDEFGNIYVSGGSWNSSTNWDCVTIKYNTNGKQLWVQKYNGLTSRDEFVRAMAVDKSGNIYVSGDSYVQSNKDFCDYFTVKYNTNGKQLWVQGYNGTGDERDHAYANAVDGSGNVYVSGDSWGSDQDYNCVTIKYNASGKQLWVQRYDLRAEALALDKSGNVYITGSSRGSSAKSDCTTIKYNTNGKRLWVKRYNGPGKDDDFARAIAVDGSGNVYVTGESKGSGSYFDYVTIKY